MKSRTGYPSGYQATRGNGIRLVAPFNFSSPGWEFRSINILINQHKCAEHLLQITGNNSGYIDDITVISKGLGDPHGADPILDGGPAQDASRRQEENAANPAKKKSPIDAVSTLENTVKYGIHISCSKPLGIKARAPLQGPSVLFVYLCGVTLTKMCQDATSRCLCPPQPGTFRWLAGAPGGWWPNRVEAESTDDDGLTYSPPDSPIYTGRREPIIIELDSSDEESTDNIEVVDLVSSYDETSQQQPPLKKRRVIIEAPFEPSSASPAPIGPSLAEPAPQPRELPHGAPPGGEPQQPSPMLPHGQFNDLTLEGDNEPEDTDSLDTCSITAIASSSSSAYASASESEEEQPSGSAHRPSSSQLHQAATHPATGPQVPTAPANEARRRRRSRKEREARNANWAASNDACFSPRSVLLSSLQSDSEDEPENSAKSCADEMIFKLSEYDRMVAIFRATRAPQDGERLYNYVCEAVARSKRAIRLQKWRQERRDEELRRLRQETAEANFFINELRSTFDDDAPAQPQPGPSGVKTKKTVQKKTNVQRDSAMPRAGPSSASARPNVMPTTPTPAQDWGSIASTSTYPTRASATVTSESGWVTAATTNTWLNENTRGSGSREANNTNPAPILMAARITQTRHIDFLALLNDMPTMGSPAAPLQTPLQDQREDDMGSDLISLDTVMARPTMSPFMLPAPTPTPVAPADFTFPEPIATSAATSPVSDMPATPTWTRHVSTPVREADLQPCPTPSTSGTGDNEVFESEELPPTPATPAHLEQRNREVFPNNADVPFARPSSPPRFVAEPMESESGTPLRMRIRRVPSNTPTDRRSKQ
ncbi:hypothetical protein QAD02_016847 [Eretmocerus hayati]|uniref:Uncharacterized protein n=1 Tax=Eretmocerus hayati TaxID=131215 RepID=A0ACC2PH24_9HYME|nr:hypothetical protein QAD02_016847 [Eretmocerus hayati]